MWVVLRTEFSPIRMQPLCASGRRITMGCNPTWGIHAWHCYPPAAAPITHPRLMLPAKTMACAQQKAGVPPAETSRPKRGTAVSSSGRLERLRPQRPRSADFQSAAGRFHSAHVAAVGSSQTRVFRHVKARGRGTFRNSACMRCSELEGGAEPCVFAECCGLKSALLDALIFGARSRDAFSCIRAIPRCTHPPRLTLPANTTERAQQKAGVPPAETSRPKRGTAVSSSGRWWSPSWWTRGPGSGATCGSSFLPWWW